MRGRLSLAALLLASANSLAAGDFAVHTTTGGVSRVSIAKGPAGDFFAAWEQFYTHARRYGPDGLPLGPEFFAGFSEGSVARFPDGSHMVVYSFEDLISPHFAQCFLCYRLFAPDGSPAGEACRSLSYKMFGCSPVFPAAATQPDGSGVVVYHDTGATGSGIYSWRFPSQGNLPGSIAFPGRHAGIGAGPAGDLAITWWGPSQPGSELIAIFMRLFALDGTPLGPEFTVSQTLVTPEDVPHPAVAYGPAGRLLVVWHGYDPSSGDTFGASVQARFVAPDGTPLGPQFQVNTLTPGHQRSPRVAALPDGSFLVTWQSQGSYGTDASGYSIQARRFLADGTPAGPEYQVNALETGDQLGPDVAVDAAGTPTFLWASQGTEVRASDDRTDLAITITDGATTTQPGATLQYVVSVTDTGPADATGALVSTPFPPSLSCTWTCTGTGGASCGSGVHPGDIDDLANLPVGGVATYVATCLVGSGASGDLVVTAQVAAPASLVDTDAADNTATDVTQVLGLVIDDVAVEEGNAGAAPASFVVRLLSPRPSPVTIDFATGDGTASSGSDYVSGAGSLTFAPGETLLTLDVSVLGDVTFEVDETLFVTLSNVVGAPLVDDLAQGTILNDDSGLPSGSLDELSHGSSEVRDLASAPGPAAIAQYWSLRQEPYSSYEVVVDGTSGDLGPEGPALERVSSDGAIVQRAAGAGATRSLRWVSDVAETSQRIRVQSRGCIDDCDAADVFRVRMWETTAFLARFNNSATQATVVLLQNPTPEAVAGQLIFSAQDGSGLWQEPFSLAPGGTLALSTASIPALQGQAGAVRVANDAAYGRLQGKAVALEPATGFTFDTPLAPRPR